MTDPQPPDQPTPDQPLSPQFRVPPMAPVRPDGFDDPQGRKKRMRLGIIGAAVGIGIPLIVLAVAVVLVLTSTAGDIYRGTGGMFVLLAGTVLVSPIQIITGIVLAAVRRTRPFGVGFLISSAVGLIVMAGSCFAIPTVFG